MGDISTDDVRTAAELVAEVARTVRSNVPGEVGDVAIAMHGSASAAAGQSWATALTQSFADWGTRLEEHAQAMRDAAGDWERTDDGVADDFRQYPQTPTGPDAWPTQPGGPGQCFEDDPVPGAPQNPFGNPQNPFGNPQNPFGNPPPWNGATSERVADPAPVENAEAESTRGHRGGGGRF